VSSGYWINVIRVSGGVVAGQAIGIAGYFALTRLFSPTAFGTYASWLAIVMIGSVVCTGALETSLVRDSDGAKRGEAAMRILGFTAVCAVAFGVGCAVFFSFFPAFFDLHWMLLGGSFGIAVAATATGTVLQSWAAAEGYFKSLTRMRIVQSGLIMLVPLGLSISGRDSGQLILGHTLGLFVAAIIWISVFARQGVEWRHLWRWGGFLRDRRRCFIYVLPGLLIGVLVGNLPQLFVKWRFGSAQAGHLALAMRVLGVPLSLVGVAVRDVFKRYAGVAYRDRGDCAKEFWSSLFALTFVSGLFAVVMLTIGERLFVLVFGEAWREAGRMAVWLTPMFVVGLVASPLTYLVYIVEREDFDLYWQTTLLFVVLIVFAVADEVEPLLKLYSFAYAAMYVVYLASCARFARGLGGRKVV
jgi:O-antigen/teichoic acid export membrane protein